MRNCFTNEEWRHRSCVKQFSQAATSYGHLCEIQSFQPCSNVVMRYTRVGRRVCASQTLVVGTRIAMTKVPLHVRRIHSWPFLGSRLTLLPCTMICCLGLTSLCNKEDIQYWFVCERAEAWRRRSPHQPPYFLVAQRIRIYLQARFRPAAIAVPLCRCPRRRQTHLRRPTIPTDQTPNLGMMVFRSLSRISSIRYIAVQDTASERPGDVCGRQARRKLRWLASDILM